MHPPVVSARPAPKPRFRDEVQGLRALAILLVVIYHVWIGRVSGGVDTFLLISTFLMGLAMMRRIDRGEVINLPGRIAHIFKRLLPAAAATILLTLLAAALLMPANHWRSVWTHGWASLFYVENWALIANNVDYYAPQSPNPFQHF